MAAKGRTFPFLREGGRVRNRRISPVAAHSGDRLLSKPTAGTQPCRREPLFMPDSGPTPSTAGLPKRRDGLFQALLRDDGELSTQRLLDTERLFSTCHDAPKKHGSGLAEPD